MNNYCLVVLCFLTVAFLGIFNISGASGYEVNSYYATNFLRSRRQVNGSNSGCKLPDHPENGQWTLFSGDSGQPGQYVDSSRVLMYTCNNGYKLSSSGNLLPCISGHWEGPFPRCLQLCPKLYNTESTRVRCFDEKNEIEIRCDEAADESYAKFQCVPYYETEARLNKKIHCRSGSWNLPSPICLPACGEKPISGEPLIVSGKTITVGDYPWVTAIYRKDGESFEHICGGTIFTPRHVLTAAHCVTDGVGNSLDTAKIKVAAGIYYNKYNDQRVTLAQYAVIEKVLVNPSYKGDSQRFSSDIAILVTEPFLLSKFVRPVCFRDLPHIHLTDKAIGTIAGWGYGKTGQGPSEELQEISVPFKTNATCQSVLSPDWKDAYNGFDKFCAGRYDSSIEICKGNGGNGLVFKNPENGRFYIHGLVSVEWKLNTVGCHRQISTLYTKVSLHYEWLEQTVDSLI